MVILRFNQSQDDDDGYGDMITIEYGVSFALGLRINCMSSLGLFLSLANLIPQRVPLIDPLFLPQCYLGQASSFEWIRRQRFENRVLVISSSFDVDRDGFVRRPFERPQSPLTSPPPLPRQPVATRVITIYDAEHESRASARDERGDPLDAPITANIIG